jgi:hypothetical protein
MNQFENVKSLYRQSYESALQAAGDAREEVDKIIAEFVRLAQWDPAWFKLHSMTPISDDVYDIVLAVKCDESQAEPILVPMTFGHITVDRDKTVTIGKDAMIWGVGPYLREGQKTLKQICEAILKAVSEAVIATRKAEGRAAATIKPAQ